MHSGGERLDGLSSKVQVWTVTCPIMFTAALLPDFNRVPNLQDAWVGFRIETHRRGMSDELLELFTRTGRIIPASQTA